jgi:hypothetical protein
MIPGRSSNNSFNRLTLNFYDKEIEKEFLLDYGNKSAKIVQAGLLLGAFVYILIGLYLDKKFFPADPEILLLWRIGGAIVMIAAVVLLQAKLLRRYFQLIVMISLTVVSVALIKIALTYIEGGLYNSSIGVTAFIIFMHTLSRIKFIYTTAITWIFIVAHIVLVQNISMPDIVVTQSISFFPVINLFLMSASYWIEYNIRENFIKSKQLHISRQQLETENKRKGDELASVKELQLSLLPEKCPPLKSVDIAFNMETATEVGGDYCDFTRGFDNSLSFAIGDATGHGARASTMVMATKMLFNEYASRKTVSGFLRHATSTIKNLKLPKLYMAFAFGRITGNKLEISGAGIPPALLYKSSTGKIEYIELKGLPLGTYVVSDYEEKEYILEPNDILLMMTDGVTEMFNSNEEMYETNLIEKQIKEITHLPAQEIIDHLFKYAHEWRGNEPLHDDMTMLILKIKE